MAKKTKKKTTKKKIVKKSAKKKPAAKKVASKKSTKKKSTKKAASKKKVTKKSTKKKSAKKVTKKKPTKKTAKKSTKKTVKKSTKKVTKKPSAKKAAMTKRIVKANGKPKKKKKKTPMSDRVARIRESLRRGRENVKQDKYEARSLTTAELKKIKSGLARKDMNLYRNNLLAKRYEILKDVEALKNESLNSGEGISYEHMADVGTDNYEQEFTIGLMESEKKLLKQIDEALIRMREGTYGVCVETGKPIGKTRLDAKPWAKWSIEVARAKERLGLK